MKAFKSICAAAVGVLLLALTGCNNTGTLSLKKLESEPKMPEWFTPIETDVAESIYAEIVPGRLNYENMKMASRKFIYLLDAHPESKRMPFWLLNSAEALLQMDEDHLSYYYSKKVVELPDSTPCTDEGRGMPDLNAYKKRAAYLMLRVLARNGLQEEFLSKVKEVTPGTSNEYFELAKDYMLLGDTAQSIAMLEQTLMDKNIILSFRKASYTAGACAMAFAMGEHNKVADFSQWMVDEGRNSETHIPGNKPGYLMNQWQSSYDVVMVFRELAAKGVSPELSGLKDGVYNQSVRGFLDLVDITVTVEKGKVVDVTAVNRKDDRPYTAFTIVPERIKKQNTLMADTISSATVTSAAILAATGKALEEAEE